MSLTKDNSDILKAPKKKVVLSEEAKGFKKTIEEVDKDLSKSSFGKLLVDVKSEQSLTEAQKKALAKKKRELAKKKKEKEYMDSLEQAKSNLASSATNIDIVKEGDKKGEVQIDMDLEKLVNNESGEKVEMDNVFTPDVMGFSIQVTQQDEKGKDKLVLDQKVKRGVVNGNVVYYYLNKEGKKTPLDIPTKGKAVIKIAPDELMNKSRSEVRELLKEEAIVRARKEAKKELSDVSSSTLKVEEKPKSRKRRISSDVAVDVLGDQSSSRGSSSSSSRSSSSRGSSSSSSRSSSSSSSRSSRSSSSRSSSRGSSRKSSSERKEHSHERSGSRSFEVSSSLSSEPIVSIYHDSISTPKDVLRLRFSAMQAFLKAQEIAKKDGYELRVFSAYRDKKHQARLWRRALKKYGSPEKARKWVAPPGGSNHQTGGTIDVNAVNIATGKKDASYLKKILPALGFENYKTEPWHWEFYSGRNTGKKNVYAKVMSVDSDDIIPYETYLAKVEEEKEKQMLASKPGVIEEGVNSKFSAEIEKFKGLKWAGRLSGNGGRDVAVLVPPHFDASKPAKILYHFHGSESERWEKGYQSHGVNIPENRFNQTATQVASRTDSNTILIYPISGGPKGRSKRSDSDWMHTSRTGDGDNMNRFHAEVLDVVKSKLNLDINVGQIAAQGHSAGGKPLRNAAQSGFAFDKIVFLDATYGRWGRDCYAAAIKNNPNVDFRVVYKKNTQTDPDAVALAGKKNVTLEPTRTSHGSMNTHYFDGEFIA